MSLGASATVCDLLRGVPDTPAALVLTWMLSLLIFTARCGLLFPALVSGAGEPVVGLGPLTSLVGPPQLGYSSDS